MFGEGPVDAEIVLVAYARDRLHSVERDPDVAADVLARGTLERGLVGYAVKGEQP